MGAVAPLMLKTAANPGGVPLEVFDGIRAGVARDRSQVYRDLSTPFYGADRPGAQVSPGLLEQFWLWGMQVGLRGALDCIRAFSESDFTADLRRFDVPTLIIHGDDDQIVPIDITARLSHQLVKDPILKVYPGGSHGLTSTQPEQFNADLWEFIRA